MPRAEPTAEEVADLAKKKKTTKKSAADKPTKPTKSATAKSAKGAGETVKSAVKKKVAKPKATKRKEADEDDDEENAEDDTPLQDEPAPKSSKKGKKKQTNAEDSDDDEKGKAADEEAAKKDSKERDPAKALKTRREHKRCSGYRMKAKEVGYLRVGGGIDMHKSVLSNADAKRLLRFYPEVLEKSSYSEEETKERMMLSDEALPTATARVAQANLEPLMRYLMTESLWHATENNKMRVNAQHVHAAFRRYAPYMRYTAVEPPKGLIKHALKEGVSGMQAYDTDLNEDFLQNEKDENASLVKQQKVMESAELARKAAFKKRKHELIAARELAATQADA